MFVAAVLCSDRVSQMTKTYNDVDAVTRLLEEVTYVFQKENRTVLMSLCFLARTLSERLEGKPCQYGR